MIYGFIDQLISQEQNGWISLITPYIHISLRVTKSTIYCEYSMLYITLFIVAENNEIFEYQV